MNWTLFVWLVWAVNILCKAQLSEEQGYILSHSGYHLCERNETRIVSYTVQYSVPYIVSWRCGAWIPWKTCQVTKYRAMQYTEYKAVTEQVIRCCDGFTQIGHYCALTESRSREITAKPGSCPTADGLDGDKDCEWDTDCLGWQKCCQTPSYFACTDPTTGSGDLNKEVSQFNATVTIKIPYQDLMSREGGLHNHTRLLYAMVMGVLESNAPIHYLGSQPVHPYRTATSLMIRCKFSPCLNNVTSLLHRLLLLIEEVSSVTVEDIDECALPFLHRCSPHADCVNTVGFFTCTCRPGYTDVDPADPGTNCTALSTPSPLSMTSPSDLGSTMETSVSWNTVTPHLTEMSSSPSACPTPSIANLRAANVTSTSFRVAWAAQFPGKQSYRVVVNKGAEVVFLNETTKIMVEVSGLQAGALYEVTVTPYACGRRGTSSQLSVKTEAQTLDATARLTNVEYTSDLQNVSSTSYLNLTASIYMEIYQSLPPEMRALVDLGRVRIEITGFAQGSVVVSFTLVFILSQSEDIDNVSTALMESLKNSSKYDVDANKTGLKDRDECTSGENDCSPAATCHNLWGSYVCACIAGFVDGNPERPGRSCQAIATTTFTSEAAGNTTMTTQIAPLTADQSTTATTAGLTTSSPRSVSTVSTTLMAVAPVASNASTTTAVPTTTTASTSSTTTAVPPTTASTSTTTTVSTTTTAAPTTSTAAPVTSTAAPKTSTAAPMTFTAAPKTSTAAPMTSTAAPVTSTAAPMTSTAAPVTSTAAPKTSTAAPVTSTAAPKTSTAAPVTSAAAPVTSTAAPMTSTLALVTSTAAPMTTTAAPVTSTAVPMTTTAAPVTFAAAPVTSTAAPMTSTLAPVTSTAAPMTTTAAPVTSTAAPMTTIAAPVTSTAAPMTTTAAPMTSAAAPMTSTAAAVASTAAPLTSTAASVTSTAPPMTSTAAPMTPTAPPMMSTAAPITSTAAPMTSTAAPMTTTAVPMTSTALPMTTTPVPTTSIAASPTTITAAKTPTATALTTTAVSMTTTSPPVATTAVPKTTVADTTTTFVSMTTTTNIKTSPLLTSTVAASSLLTTTVSPTTKPNWSPTTQLITKTTTPAAKAIPFVVPATKVSASKAIAVKCNVASISVTVDRDFLKSSQITDAALYLGRVDCGVKGGNATHVQLTVAWGECNTLIMNNNSYYTVSVTLFNSMNSSNTKQVPKIRLEIPVICSYMKNMLITSDFGSMGYDMIKDVITGSGIFQVSVQLMNGSVPLPHNFSLSPSEAVVVEVSLNTSVDKIKVVINKCWATPTSSPSLVSRYIFMENRCAMNPYTTVITNGNSSTSSLSVQVFSFVDLSIIYLHCQVEICVEMDSASCAPDCLQRTSRSGSRSTIGTALATSGPLFQLAEDPFEEEYDTASVIGLSCLGAGLAIFFIIGFVCLFFYQRNRIGHYNFNNNKPKEENFTYLNFNT